MSHSKLPDNQEDREVYLRDHNAPSLITAVTDARANDLDTVIMMLDAFHGDPELLYVALDYARSQGVTITMAPPAKTG
jgi:hypothetical protein